MMDTESVLRVPDSAGTNCARTLLSPHWGSSSFLLCTAALRRGLHSFAASPLKSLFHLESENPTSRKIGEIWGGPSFAGRSMAAVPMNLLSFESAGFGFVSSWLRISRCTMLGLAGAARVHRFPWEIPGLEPHRPPLPGSRPYGAGRNRRSCLARCVPYRL
jgi:hypothetical protein